MADQVYVTHCLQSDSVKNQGGFSIRAASTRDPELLRFALEYPPYELPLDMWSADPTPAQAPRRLALVPGPRQMMALVHSTYVGQDTLGRPGNYFTHVLYFPTLTPAQALESWGASEWTASYPQGETQSLPKAPDTPPRGPFLRERLLTTFLEGKGAATDPRQLAALCPPRLLKDPQSARDLVHKTIQALLLAREAGANPRGRLYLAAEPGLVALLLYAAVRLLPPGATDFLTFSTYETMHRTLRQFKLGWAVGTFTPNPEKKIEPDFLRARGYGLDASDAAYFSAEIAPDAPPFLEKLITLAGEGKWETLHHLHQCHGAGRATEDSLERAGLVLGLYQRAQAGKLSAEELREMGRNSAGAELIQKNPDLFWPLVYQYSLSDEAVRQQFSGVIKDRIPELLSQAGKLLAAGEMLWKSPWALVKAVEKNRERLATHWLALLNHAAKLAPTKPYLAAMRLPVLQEWHRIGPPHHPIPDPIKDFLALSSAEEYAALQAASLPGSWTAFALGDAFAAKADWAPDAFDQASDAVVQIFVGFFENKNGDVQQSAARRSAQYLLTTLWLLIPESEKLPRLFRMLRHGLALPGEAAQALLEGLEGDVPSRIWMQDDHLTLFLGQLVPAGEKSATCWERFSRLLNKDLLLGQAQQRALFQNLLEARARNPAAVPAETNQALEDWSFLTHLFTGPEGETTPKQIEAVCKRRGVPFGHELLRDYYQKGLQKLSTEDPRLETFAKTFERFFPPGTIYQHHLNRFDLWSNLRKNPEAPEAAPFHLYFLEHHVPADFRLQIAKERKRLLGEAGIQAVKRSAAERKAAPPAAAKSQSPAGLSDLFGSLSWPQRSTLLAGLLGTYLLVGMAGCWMARPAAPEPEPSGPVTPPPGADAKKNKDKEAELVSLKWDTLEKIQADLEEIQEALAAAPEELKLEGGVYQEKLAEALKQLKEQIKDKTVKDASVTDTLENLKQDVKDYQERIGKEVRKMKASASKPPKPAVSKAWDTAFHVWDKEVAALVGWNEEETKSFAKLKTKREAPFWLEALESTWRLKRDQERIAALRETTSLHPVFLDLWLEARRMEVSAFLLGLDADK